MRSTDKFVPYKNSSLRKLGKVHAIDNKLRTKEKFQRLTPACLRFSNFIVFLQLAVFLTNSTNKFVPSSNSLLPRLGEVEVIQNRQRKSQRSYCLSLQFPHQSAQNCWYVSRISRSPCLCKPAPTSFLEGGRLKAKKNSKKDKAMP